MWNKDIEIMKNYIKLKYIVFAYDKSLLDNKEYNEIEGEIKELEKIIKENKIDLNNIKNINNIKINEGNEKGGLSGEYGVNKIEYDRFEHYSVKELLNIATNRETPGELREIIYICIRINQ